MFYEGHQMSTEKLKAIITKYQMMPIIIKR